MKKPVVSSRGQKSKTVHRNQVDESFLREVYNRLFTIYGPQHWWPGETPFEVCVGAILTQNTSWTNVEKATHKMKLARCFSIQHLVDIQQDDLAELIRSAGYFNQKAKKLQIFARHIKTHYQGHLSHLLRKPGPELRRELLSLWGIGDETADSMVLYAAGHPSFVVDAYTRRMFSRLGCCSPDVSYADLQSMFMARLEHDTPLYNEYHALIVRFGKEQCKSKPLCGNCPLSDICRFRPH